MTSCSQLGIWEFSFFDDLNETGTADSDGDGLANNLEDDNLTDPTDSDSDNDGWNDGAEVTAGTDPNDPLDHPTTPVTKSKGGGGGCIPAGGGMGLLVLLGACLSLLTLRRRS